MTDYDIHLIERNPVPPNSKREFTKGTIVALIGAGLIIVAGALPWANITSIFGTISMSGFQVGGGLPGIVSLILGVFGLFVVYSGDWRFKRIMCFVVGGVVFLMDLSMFSRMAEISAEVSSPYVMASAGEGLFLSFVGFFLIVIGGILIGSEKKEAEPVAPVQPVTRVCPACGKDLTQFPNDIKKCPYCAKDLTSKNRGR